MKQILAIALIVLPFGLGAQHGIGFESGLNKIGVHFDPTYRFLKKGYQLDAGLRFYGMDQLFEKKMPGLLIRNGYYTKTKNDKQGAGIVLTTGFFRENKLAVNLYVLDVMLGPSGEFHFFNYWTFYLRPGLGFVSTFSQSKQELNKKAFTYLNYELAIGLKFTFGGAGADSDK